MATTAEGRALTERHRRIQIRLAGATVLQMRQLWRILDLEDIDSTVPAWLAASRRLIRSRNRASAVISERYFREFRAAEVGQPPTATLPTPGLNIEAVDTSLLVTGPYRLRERLGKGRTLEEAARVALAASAAAAARHSLNGGRDMLLGAVAQDSRAVGWARVTSSKPCAFCALLASRGPVFTRQTVRFQAHDSCRCTAEPAYSTSTEWPGQAREWADLYATSAKGQPDPAVAFRRAYEGRNP